MPRQELGLSLLGHDFPSALGCGSRTATAGTEEFLLQETLKAEGKNLMFFPSPTLLRVEGTCKGFVALMGPSGGPGGALPGAAHWKHKKTGPLSQLS